MKLALAGGALALTLALSATALSARHTSAHKAAPAAAAKVITVQMKDSGPEGMMTFVPSFVKANVGDTIHFVPANGSHNAETIAAMLPDGVVPSQGAMGQPFDLKLTTAGLYGVKCKPHYSMGMVALIQAGNGPSPNLAKAKAATLPSFAGKRMTIYLAKAS